MDSIKSTVAAVLARELTPHIPQCNTIARAFVPVATPASQITMPMTQVTASQALMSTATQATLMTTACSPPSTPTVSPSIFPSEVELSDVPNRMETDVSLVEEPISIPDLTGIFTKSISRRNFAANLVRSLFTKEVRMRCNVNGRGKDMLDPNLIRFVKNKCFEYFPLSGTEKLAEKWGECVVSIDEANRRLKNKPSKKLMEATP